MHTGSCVLNLHVLQVGNVFVFPNTISLSTDVKQHFRDPQYVFSIQYALHKEEALV